jgi:hypothetical protein
MKYKIDESHGLSHSMNVLTYANQIYECEEPKNPRLKLEERTIYVSAILHDMCDKKYMKEDEGIKQIEDFLQEEMTQDEIETTKQIISTMSYSKVMEYGFAKFPRMKTSEKQMAYHIVRESDLLTAYDFDRSMIYHLHCSKTNPNPNIEGAFINANDIFLNRVFKHEDNGLLLTEFSIKEAQNLKTQSLKRIDLWKKLIKNPRLSL